MIALHRKLNTRSYRACLAAIFLCAAAVGRAEISVPAGHFIAKLAIDSSGALGKRTLDTSEGDFPTIQAAPKEGLKIALTVPSALAGKALNLRAADGGVIKGGKDGIFSVASRDGEGVLKFEYFPGDTIGRYTVKIIGPGYMQVLEFWVGPLRPQAPPGPRGEFSAPKPEIPKVPMP